MSVRLLVLSLICLLMIIYAGCSFGVGSEPDPGGQVFVEDRTGREWDVTHARDVYGMDPGYFNFGLGVGVIASVDGPEIIGEGDPRYPESSAKVPVFGVSHNGEQRAYSVSDLSRHEVFNDEYPGESDKYVSVTYWPLADLAVVYSREIDGRQITLAPSGWTYGENAGRSVFVLFDKETDSLWYPIDQPCCTLPTEEIGGTGLVGIGGVYADRVLGQIQTMSITTWSDWKARFPDTKFVRE